jgi:hypothetical protein
MVFRLLADLVLVLHLVFLLYVVAGGLLVLRWPRSAWLHLPAMAWGTWTEFAGIICPLTPLENHFRRLGGQAGYAGGFIEHYVTGTLYPQGLTRGMQLVLGLAAVAINVAVYWYVLRARRPARGER